MFALFIGSRAHPAWPIGASKQICNKRWITKLFIRFIPGPQQISELRSLVTEYHQLASACLRIKTGVRVPLDTEKENAKGFAFLDFQSSDQIPKALMQLQKLKKLSSGRPVMVPQYSVMTTTLFLTAAPDDPWVLKYQKVENILQEVVREYGEVSDMHVPRSYGWVMGWAYVFLRDGPRAKEAAALLHRKTIKEFDFPMQVKSIPWQPKPG